MRLLWAVLVVCLCKVPLALASCYSGVAQPTLASTNGFNCLKFYDNFGSLSTFDTTNSQAPGFNWYETTYGGGLTPYPPTPSSSYSVASNKLTLSDQPDPGYGLVTLSPTNASTQTYIGTFFKPPFYVSYNEAVNQSLAPGVAKLADIGCGLGAAPVSRITWPVVWMQDYRVSMDQTVGASNLSTPYSLAEIDILENAVICPGGSGSGNMGFQSNVYEWTSWNGFGNFCQNNVTTPGPWDGTTMHHEEMVLQTITSGGGTGSATFYHDSVQTAKCTWTSPNTFVDRSQFVLIVASGYSWPISVSNMQIWDASSSPPLSNGLAANDNRPIMLGEKRRVAAR